MPPQSPPPAPPALPADIPTLSAALVEDWLAALRTLRSPAQMASLLARAGLGPAPLPPHRRVTLEEIVRLYQLAAIETGDEMMGLWSRPIRPRALQHLLTSVREASSLPAALHRFTTFWNLLLDDHQLALTAAPEGLRLSLLPAPGAVPQRFGHMLLLKLAHGLLSWLAGREVPAASIRFAFPRPEFAADYASLFPAPVLFDAPASAISFDPGALPPPIPRSKSALNAFLTQAPRDWLFTRSRAHSLPLRLRGMMHRADWADCRLPPMARALGMTPRTLIRRLEADQTSFQAIKDGLRRDLALRALADGDQSLERIAADLGFSSAANFHRAFRRWTGAAPGRYRQTAARAAMPPAPKDAP